MSGRKINNRAGQKASKLGTSLSGASSERPLQDTPDGQIINKLAATVA